MSGTLHEVASSCDMHMTDPDRSEPTLVLPFRGIPSFPLLFLHLVLPSPLIMPKKKGKKGKKDKKKASRKQSIYEELSPPNFGTPVSSQDSDGSLASWSDHDKKWAFRDLRDLEETLAKGEKQYDTECILRYRRHPRQGYGQYRTKWEGFPIRELSIYWFAQDTRSLTSVP